MGNYTNCTTLEAYKAAHGGFLGPLCELCTDPSSPACAQPPPPPSPSPPSPPSPADGVALMDMASRLCIVPQSNSKRAPVAMGNCSSPRARSWALQGPNNTVVNSADPDLCLRPQTPPKLPQDCVAGTPLIVGSKGCLVLAGQSLVAPCTPAMCASVLGERGVLGLCNTSWAVQK